MAILPNLAQQNADILAQLAALRAENEALKAKQATSSNIKISPKGGVSVYSLGKWPVTLYVSQWEKLFDRIDEIKAFIEANRSKLSNKADAAADQD